MDEDTQAYRGEFPDNHSEELRQDNRIEIVSVEDGEFGLDGGTKHVEFRINSGEVFDSDAETGDQ